MSLDIEPTTKEPLAIAEEAIVYALRRIRDDANIGYHCGWGTQMFSLLVQAASRLNNVPVEEVQEMYAPRGRKSEREIPRYDLRELIDEIDGGQFAEPRDVSKQLRKLLDESEAA